MLCGHLPVVCWAVGVRGVLPRLRFRHRVERADAVRVGFVRLGKREQCVHEVRRRQVSECDHLHELRSLHEWALLCRGVERASAMSGGHVLELYERSERCILYGVSAGILLLRGCNRTSAVPAGKLCIQFFEPALHSMSNDNISASSRQDPV